MPVTVLSYQDRLRIAELLDNGIRISDIAGELHVSDSTIYSEIVRGGGTFNKLTRRYVGYIPDKGHAAVGGRYRKYRRLG